MDEWLDMIDDCEDRESQLSEWEAGFIDSIREWVEKGRSLSPKQDEALTRIWDRVTSRG